MKLARQNLEDTPDACIVSHQLRTTAFSSFEGNGYWCWKYVCEFRRVAAEVGQNQDDCAKFDDVVAAECSRRVWQQ